MDILENILSQEVVQKLGWTLLHSIWQGGVVVLLLAVLLRVLRKSSASLRYVVACLGLAVIVLLPVVTFYVAPTPAPTSDVESIPTSPVMVTAQLSEIYDADMPLQRAAEYMQTFGAISWRQRAKNLYTSALPSVVLGWFIGVLALFLWHLGGWAHLQRLKRKNMNHVNASLKDKLHNLAERLKVTRPVKLMESALVQIPTVVGWLRPVVLLPASALTGLTSEQLEAVLAHELAHIRRYDYLVNMLQTVVEIVGFYHPGVWWVSHKMRVERENCCDDLAVSVCGDKVGYARALTSMEEIRLSQGELVIAASGGNLFTRISRLVGKDSVEKNRRGWAPAVFSALLIIALAIPTTLALTATDSGSGLRADSITTHVNDSVDEDNISSSVATHSASILPVTDSKIEIRFDCKIYEVPTGLKIFKGKQKGNLIIDIGGEYAEQLEALSRESKNVKLIANPTLLTLDGKQGIIKSDSALPYTAGYETGEDAGDEPKPITRMASAGLELKIKGKARENGQELDLDMRYRQFKPSFGTHKDDKGREIQIPVTETSECITCVTLRSGETIVIGGLRSKEPSSNLILMITPSIVHPDKGIESKVETDQRLLEQDKAKLLYDALDEQAAELQQMLFDVQMKLAELETRKAELKGLSSVLASPKKAESQRKRAKNGEEPRYHTVREGDPVAVLSEVLDDERVEAEMATIQAEMDLVEAQLTELLRNYVADVNNRESEWRAELRAFTADVVAANARIVDANAILENDEATLKDMKLEIQRFKFENQAKLDTDIALYNKLQTMKTNYDTLARKINRDQGVLDKYKKLLEEAEQRKKRYEDYIPNVGTKDDDAQRVIDLAKEALERRKAELKGLSSVLASPKKAESGHEWLDVMAARFAERDDFAKAAEYQEMAIEFAKTRKYYGIGIAIEKKDGLIRIGGVLPNTPASGSSFQQGDIIEAVDGVSTEGMSLDDVVARIVGPKGTEVTLSVKSRSQDVAENRTFTRQLPLEGSHVLRAYEWRLVAYKSGKTWPQYRRRMEDQKAQTAGAPRIFELRYASAEELAEVLSRILKRRWKGVKDRSKQAVRIIPEPNRNRLIVIASPDDIQLIEALVAELDIITKRDTVIIKAAPSTKAKQDSPAENTFTQIIKLKYADCESLAEKLTMLFADEQLRIVPHKHTNTLLVAGTESAIKKMKDVVAAIDVRGSDTKLKVIDTTKQD